MALEDGEGTNGLKFGKGETFLQIKAKKKSARVSRPYGEVLEGEIPLSKLQRKDRAQWTCEEVCEYIIKPACMSCDSYYTDLIKKRQGGIVCDNDFERGTFVSYARQTPFVAVVDALDNYFKSEPNINVDESFVWMDIFCANQPELTKEVEDEEVTKLMQELLKEGMHQAISKFPYRVMVFDSWNDPAPLKRAWCVWELFAVALNKQLLGIAMTPLEEDKYLSALRRDATEYGSVMKSLSSINIATAKCFRAKDREMIMQAIAENSSVAEVNETVLGRLRDWHVATAEKQIDKEIKKGNGNGEEYLGLLNSLVQLLGIHNQLEKAESKLQELIEKGKKILGTDHPKVATFLNNYAILLTDKGEYSEAESVVLEVLRIDEKHHNTKNHAIHAISLGGIYFKQGRLEESRQVLSNAVDALKKLGASENATLAAAQTNLGVTLQQMGLYDEAEKLYMQSKEIRSRVFGDTHAEVANSLNNIAMLYKDRGDLAHAMANQTNALEIHKKVFGEIHPEVARDLNNLGHIFMLQENYEEAESTQRDVLEMYRKLFGNNHPDVALAANNLAQTLRVQGKLEEAEHLQRECIEIRKKVFPKENPFLASDLTSLALILRLSGKLDDAVELYSQACTMVRKTYGNDHQQVAEVESHIAETLKLQERFEDAEHHMREALKIWRMIHGNDDPQSAIILNGLAEILQAQNKVEEAKLEATEAVRILALALGDDHPTVQALRTAYNISE